MEKKMKLHISTLYPLKGRLNSNLLSLIIEIIVPLRGLGVIITKN